MEEVEKASMLEAISITDACMLNAASSCGEVDGIHYALNGFDTTARSNVGHQVREKKKKICDMLYMTGYWRQVKNDMYLPYR
jgi:hypothetical protein